MLSESELNGDISSSEFRAAPRHRQEEQRYDEFRLSSLEAERQTKGARPARGDPKALNPPFRQILTDDVRRAISAAAARHGHGTGSELARPPLGIYESVGGTAVIAGLLTLYETTGPHLSLHGTRLAEGGSTFIGPPRSTAGNAGTCRPPSFAGQIATDPSRGRHRTCREPGAFQPSMPVARCASTSHFPTIQSERGATGGRAGDDGVDRIGPRSSERFGRSRG